MMIRGLRRALSSFLITARSAIATDQEPVPAGWDNATLLAAARVDGIVFD